MRKAQFRKLILGDYPYIPSNSTYKRVILTGLMSIITAIISISFLFLDLATTEKNYEFICVACILMALYTAKEAVNKLGGNISVQSALGEGTRFHVKIPVSNTFKKVL